MSLPGILLTALGAVLFLMLGAWILALLHKKACVADSFWGLGFVLIAWLAWTMGPETSRGFLVAVLISIWGLRLFLHITIRNWGQPEDRRYRAMRENYGRSFWWVSLFSVFLLQGVLLWVISLAPQLAQLSPGPAKLTWLDGLGLFVWAAGFIFEVASDYQMKRFRSNPANKGKVMDKGLWGYSRHPNYFGESLIWWGIFIIALATPYGWLAIISPLLITFLLLKVSGVVMLEKDISSRRPGYEEYKHRVSAFIPWFRMGE
jgi:steroid 5-alpha reductase family enzyme